jgi:hypothetical protein
MTRISEWRTSTERAAGKSVTRLWTDRAGVVSILIILVGEVIAIAGDRLGMSYHERATWAYPLLVVGLSTCGASFLSGIVDDQRKNKNEINDDEMSKTDKIDKIDG